MKVGMEKFIPPSRWLRYRLIENILSQIKFPSSFVLEIGSGGGGFLVWMKEKGFKCIGVDISRQAVEIALKNVLKDIYLINGDIQCIKGTFSLICAFSILEHIEDDASFIKDMLDRIESKGYLLLGFPAKSSLYCECDIFYGHYRRYDFDDFKRLLAGMPVEIIFYYTYGSSLVYKLGSLLFWVQIKRARNRSKIKSTEISGITKPPLLWKIFYPLFRPFYPLIYYYFQFLKKTSKRGTNTLVLIRKL